MARTQPIPFDFSGTKGKLNEIIKPYEELYLSLCILSLPSSIHPIVWELFRRAVVELSFITIGEQYSPAQE